MHFILWINISERNEPLCSHKDGFHIAAPCLGHVNTLASKVAILSKLCVTQKFEGMTRLEWKRQNVMHGFEECGWETWRNVDKDVINGKKK